MRRVTSALAIAAVAAWSSAVFAQGRNFAGSWTVDSEKMATLATAGGGGMVRSGAEVPTGAARSGGGGGAVAAGGGGMVRSAGGEVPTAAARGGGGGGRGGGMAGGPTTIALDATTFTVGTQAYKLDGSATTLPNGTAKAAWKGDKLVVDATTEGPNGSRTITTSWYLDGNWLVQERSIPAPDGGDPRVTKTYFKKAS